MDRQLHDSIFNGSFRLPPRAPADSRTKPTARARAHSVERRLMTRMKREALEKINRSAGEVACAPAERMHVHGPMSQYNSE